jgi:hypothetical protein
MTSIAPAQDRNAALREAITSQLAELVRAETLPHRQATAIERRRADRAEAESSRLRRAMTDMRNALREARETGNAAALKDAAERVEGALGTMANGEGETER